MSSYLQPRPLLEGDDRDSFDCGRDSLNAWFRERAWKNQLANVSRTSVLTETGGTRIAGFVSLSAAQIERAFLSKRFQRNMPDPVPAILLGQLAVDLRDQRKGVAASLMFFVFSTVARAASEIGCYALTTHPLDDALRDYYRKFGFDDLPFDPGRAMFARIVDMRQNGF